MLAIWLAIIAALITFQGISTHTIGGSTETGAASQTAAPLAQSSPVLVADGRRLVGVQPPAGRRIALTFDDGPDPRWTPRIAATLRRLGVPATFFVIGSQAARHPGLIRASIADGDEIGNHTFTHVALSNVPPYQRHLQLDLTEATLVGITGHYTRLFRPPYSATPDAVTPRQEADLAQLAGQRYYVVLANFDSEDWQRPGVAKIIARASPPGSTGGIIMLHDGGGDRSQTVAAIAPLIANLRRRGFRFVTVSSLAGLPSGAAEPTAAPGSHRRGAAFALAVRLAFALTAVFAVVLLSVGALVGARAVLLLTLASHHRRTLHRRYRPHASQPGVAVIVPAYNEAVGIERTVRSLTASDYPALEVIVVDDGSTDSTAAIVASLSLPEMHLVRQDNGGKAAALNTGIDVTEAEIIVMVDGDTIFEPDTIERLIAPLADPAVGAVSGNTKVGNRQGLLGRWQHIEYVIGFNLDRRMYEVLQCTPTVPGAIGAFRRTALEQVGGVPLDTLAEDTDLTLSIGRGGWRVVYAQDARAWTEAPATLNGLWRQRYRWSFGTMQAIWKHRGAMLSRDPAQRGIGRRALPYMFLFQILLPIAAPLIDLFALYGLIFTNAQHVILAWLAFNAVQLLIAVYGFRLDGESLRPLWALPLQQFVYRQIMYLVIIESTVSALVGARANWRTIPRTGAVRVEPDRA